MRGTTPLLEFLLPFDASELAEACITLSQQDTEVLSKYLADCRREQQLLSVRLSQEETLLLESRFPTEIQLRARTLQGEALASEVWAVPTKRLLKDGVI